MLYYEIGIESGVNLVNQAFNVFRPVRPLYTYFDLAKPVAVRLVKCCIVRLCKEHEP